MHDIITKEVKVYFKDSRIMKEVPDKSINLIVTSPPYFEYKDYGVKTQVGFGSTFEEYIKDLVIILKECYRVLAEDGKLCINIPNPYSHIKKEGRRFIYPLIPLITLECNKEGLDLYDEIIWVKANANAGALAGKPLFGSYPYPPNFCILKSMFENILIFKKPGKREIRWSKKRISKLTKEEWREFTKGVWNISAIKQNTHIAMFPEELPRRLIKLYSFVGDTILDPFVGSGTTLKVAKELGRIGIGYEINSKYKSIIIQKIGLQ
ncbi:MAG: site-specific DNA-methyltransferase [Nanoarchaeota archaeon]|nr:site-specific DNA-methyltransferase [Nanoarchaeota archaeon]